MGSEVKAVTTLSFEELAHKGTLLPLPLPLTIKFTPDSLPLPIYIHIQHALLTRETVVVASFVCSLA